jgi:CubicO group peptidase (beta-lactamase class C family)
MSPTAAAVRLLLSHESGVPDVTLLGETIGDNFERTAAGAGALPPQPVAHRHCAGRLTPWPGE